MTFYSLCKVTRRNIGRNQRQTKTLEIGLFRYLESKHVQLEQLFYGTHQRSESRLFFLSFE
jgi:hypothetical protein